MNERLNQAEALFHEAMDLPPGEREGFLREACGGDAALRRKVAALLRASSIAEDWLKDADCGADAPSAGLSLAGVVSEGPGTVIGRYKLLEKIGEGGMGVVYMAEQAQPVRRRVALKIIRPGMDTKSVIARFEAERQALAMMDHSNISKVHDGGVTDTGRPYFVMELVCGVRITEFCQEHRLGTRDRLDLFMQVCSAVQHAHQKGIIHRDLKPSNILVTEIDGKPVPKVIDFGVARATEQKLTDKTLFTQFAQFIGTPAYMSPEQAALTSTDLDTRSDIYSLGVLLYELLTGTTPFDAQDLLHAGFDEMRRIIRETEPPKPSTRQTQSRSRSPSAASPHSALRTPDSALRTPHSSLSSDLDWIVMKCLEKDRARRYETASGLVQDIQRHLSSEPVIARPASAAYRFRKMVRRNKLAFAAAAAVLAALVTGLGVSTWMFFREKDARDKEKLALDRAVAAEKAQSEERKKAENEASKSTQVAGFLQDMLKGVGPSVALGDDTKMLRKILDQTAERIGRELNGQPEAEADLRFTLGVTFLDLGEVEKAFEMHSRALEVRRELLGGEHVAIANSLNELGKVLLRQGQLAKAETVQREALELRRRLLGHEHTDVAISLNNLATVLEAEGKLAEAETMQRDALAMHRRTSGADHPEVANALNNLSIVLLGQNKLEEAGSVQREALALKRKLLGDKHPTIATALNNLANILEGQGKLDEAEAVYREALAMKKGLVGGEHPDVATSLTNLGHLLRRQLKLVEAESTHREALAMHRKFLGDEHPNVVASLNGLGLTLDKLGRGADAETLLREAVALERKLLGPEHPDLARVIASLALVLEGRKKFPESESLHREALAMSANLLGSEHPHVTSSLEGLAGTMRKQGKSAEANALFRDSISTSRHAAAKSPSGFEDRLQKFADALYRQSEFSKAEPLYRELIASRKSRFAADHVEVLGPNSKLARLLADWAMTEHSVTSETERGKAETRAREATGLLQECLASQMRGEYADHWTTDETRSRLGSALLAAAVTDKSLTSEARTAKFSEAEALLLQGDRGVQSITEPAGIPLRRDSLTRLVRLYHAWDKPDQAADWQRKLDELNAASAAAGK